jgi:hypothetical protein
VLSALRNVQPYQLSIQLVPAALSVGLKLPECETQFFFSSLYRAIEQDTDVIRPTICTRVFFVLKSLQF